MSNLDQGLESKKRYLKRYKKTIALVDRLKNKLEFLNEKMGSARIANYSDLPRGGIPVTEADLIADRIELEKRIKRLEVKANRYKSEILDIIDELDDIRYADILESFFIDCLSFEDIAENNCYSVRQVIRLYQEGVRLCKIPDRECQ